MTALSIGAGPVAPAPPSAPPQTSSRSQFSAVFSGARHATDDRASDSAASEKGKNDGNKGTPPTLPVHVAVLPKTILPITLSLTPDVAPAADPKETTDPQAETIDLQQPQAAPPTNDGEMAFAMKLVDNATPQQPQQQSQPQTAAPAQAPVQATLPNPIVSKQANAATVNPADAHLPVQRAAEPPQKQTDSSRPAASNATEPHAAAEPVATQPVHAISEITTLRDAPASVSAPRPAEATAQTASLSQVAAPPLEQPTSTRVNEITVRIANPDQSSTSIRMVDRSGELHVAIRATDTQVAETLRGNVEQLASKLNNNGFSAEVWKPSSITPAARSQSSSEQMSQGQDGAKEQQRDLSQRNQSNKQKYPDWVEEFYANNQ